jgi:AraC-like DNA-binding protein
VRLETAHAHLQSGKMNVYEACVAVGYSSLSNFIALFKKEFGITPGKVLQCALRTRSYPAA